MAKKHMTKVEEINALLEEIKLQPTLIWFCALQYEETYNFEYSDADDVHTEHRCHVIALSTDRHKITELKMRIDELRLASYLSFVQQFKVPDSTVKKELARCGTVEAPFDDVEDDDHEFDWKIHSFTREPIKRKPCRVHSNEG
jgi:hypothetical protein